MKTIELVINSENYIGSLKNEHLIVLESKDNCNYKYFKEWSKIKEDKFTYQDLLTDRDYKKVIQYICENDNGILSGCYPVLDDNSISIYYDMKIEIYSPKN